MPTPTDGPQSDSIEHRHIEHYRNCGCLGDSAECCVPTCPCHRIEPQITTRALWRRVLLDREFSLVEVVLIGAGIAMVWSALT